MKNPMRIVAVAAALAMLLAVSAGGASASAKHKAAGKPIIIAMPLALSGVISFYDQPNLAGERKAVFPGHHDIDQTEAELRRPVPLQPFFTIPAENGIVAAELKVLLKHEPEVLVILQHQ